MDYLRAAYTDLTSTCSFIWAIFQENCWSILIGVILLYYVFTRLLAPVVGKLNETYGRYQKRKEDADYEAKYHKNPDLFAARISAQQEAAQKLQEKYDEEARAFQEKLKEKEARKRLEVQNLLNQSDQGYKLGNSNDQPKSFKPEYHPLMGPGSSSNYRPPKKTKCGGGGCGK